MHSKLLKIASELRKAASMRSAYPYNRKTFYRNASEKPWVGLDQIADTIRDDWKKVYPAAQPYLDAMSEIDSDGMYGHDSWSRIVAGFLAAASSWQGPVAKDVKVKLKKLLKGDSRKEASALEHRQYAKKEKVPSNWNEYEAEVEKLEESGLTRSDAQGVVDARLMQEGYDPNTLKKKGSVTKPTLRS